MGITTWTDDFIERLRSYVAEGLSAKKIGEELGLSRNAVIGKIHRLGMSRERPPPVPRQRRPHRPRLGISDAERAARIAAKLAAQEAPLIVDIVDEDIPAKQRRTLAELEPHHCRWPIGQPSTPDFCFCGGPARDDSPYCAAHHARAYTPPRSRRHFDLKSREAA